MSNRRKKVVKSNPTFAIVVDGQCEVWYLQMLKRNERSITVNISPKIPQKKSLKEQFDSVLNLSKEFTKVFWILDLDVVLKESKQKKKGEKTPLQFLEEYKTRIDEEFDNIVVIINNPCIEFWLLLHFEATAKYFDNCEGAEKQLKKYLKDYEKTQSYYTKNDNDIYLKLRGALKTAIGNSKKIAAFDFKNPHSGISEMHLLFEADEFEENFIEKKSKCK